MTDNTPPRGKRTRQIAADLRKLIDEGIVGPGDRLPTESELVGRYKVTRPTVRDAYKILIASGDVVSLGLGGYFVRQVTLRRWVLSSQGEYVDPWEDLVEELGGMPRQEVTVEVVTARARLQNRSLEEWFGLSAGDSDEFALRHTLRTLDNHPVQLASAYIPQGIAEGTLLRRPTPMDQDMVSFFEDVLSRELLGCRDFVQGRMATEREIRLLELPDNATVTEVVRQMIFTDDVTVVERLVFEAVGATVISELAPLAV